MSSSCYNPSSCQEEKYSAVVPQGNQNDLGSKLSGLCCSVIQTLTATQMTTGSLLLGSKVKHTKPEVLDHGR